MLPLIIFCILSALSIGYALFRKLYRQKFLSPADRQYGELFTLGLPAVAVILNAVLVYHFMVDDLSVAEHLVQMIACCTIVPLVYMHFAWKAGSKVMNLTTVILWLLCLLLLFTNVVITNPFATFEALRFTPKPFALYVVSHGEKMWAIYTGDLIVILQALVTILHIVPLAHRLRANGLRFSRPIYLFFGWWLLTALYIASVSSLDLEQLTSTAGMWFYYMGMAVSLMSINMFYALDLDIHPVETEQGEVVESVDAYLDNLYLDLSRRMEAVMTEEQLFRQPGYTVEDMCERLQINRKVLSQMMQQRYGIRFPEYLNQQRLLHAQHLLLTSQMKITMIAEECGFSGTSHLNRLFKQQFDCTPSQWQKQHRKNTTAYA